MADDEYVAVVNAATAMQAVRAMIEARRGYLALLDQLIAPYPQDFQFDQSKRNQMMTLLSRADTLWVLCLVHSESRFAERSMATSARKQREKSLGKFLTRAAVARGLAIAETGHEAAEPSRRHTVAAARLVEAGLSYGLFELAPMPDGKQQPIEGTLKLAKFLHALGDHAYWTMHSAVEDAPSGKEAPGPGLSEAAALFRHDAASERATRSGRLTADDPVTGWLDDEV